MNVSLIMFKENGEQKEFPINPGQTVIGRKEECELRVPLAEVSRKHAILLVDDRTVTLRDLGSANGSYVNNKKISEQELAAGDHVVIGPVVFTVQIDGEPSELRPVKTRLEARSKVTEAAGSEGEPAEAAADVFAQGDEDPISALEALAASGDTAALDLGDSFTEQLEDPEQE